MCARLLTTIALAALFAAPAAAAEPVLTLQTQPIGRLLEQAKTIVKSAAGPMADEAIKQMDESLKKSLGEKGFTGVDLLRPPVGYFELQEDVEKSYGFLVVPITNEKDFVDFLGRIKLDVDEVKDNKGLYKLTPKEGDDTGKAAIRLRVKDGYGYVGINAPDAAMAAEKLRPAAGLFIPTESAPLVVRAYISRLSPATKKYVMENLDLLSEKAKEGPIPEAGKSAMKDLLGMYKRLAGQAFDQGDLYTVRLNFDPATSEINYEVALKAKDATPLAQEIAARKVTTNRFASLLTDDAAAGLVVQLPLFAPELRTAMAGGLEALQKEAGNQVPEPYQPLVQEVVKGFGRSIKAGELDLGGALIGPDKNGLFNAAVGLSYDDTSELEKLLRKMHKDAPEEVRNLIKLDAAKAGDVAIHQIGVGFFLPAEPKKVFGGNANLCIALAPKGIYATFGPAAMDAMKAALATKPAPAKAFELTANMKRVHKLIEALQGEEAAKMVAQFIGTDDKKISAYYIDVEGGSELKMRVGMSLKLLPRAMGTVYATESKPAAAPAP